MTWQCNYSGRCELSPNGQYSSQKDCESQCQSKEDKDINYLIYQFTPTTAFSHLTPEDFAVVWSRLTNIPMPPADILPAVLQAYEDRDLEPIIPYRSLLSYDKTLGTI